MNKPWLKTYPPGTPETIDISARSSLLDMYDEAVGEFNDKPAFINMGEQITYKDLAANVRDIGAWLQNAGLDKGDRIAIMMPNCLQYPMVLFGAMSAGLTIVNTNPLYTPRELRHQLQDSGATAIVIIENFCHVLEEVIADTEIKTVITTRLGDQLSPLKGLIVNAVVKYVKKMVPAFNLPGAISLNQVITDGKRMTLNRPELNHDDIAFLQYTGGTTGVAKGAMLLHRNMLSNLAQVDAWLPSEKIVRGEETIVTALPMYHIFALTANVLTFMSLGANNLLITNPRDIPLFVKTLQKTPFTVMTGVNTLFNALLNNEDFCAMDFSQFKLGFGGGMAVQRTVAERWKQVTNTDLAEAYGLTETSPAAVINILEGQEWMGSIGLPIPSTECAIRDAEGNDLPVGEEGELCIRGPQVMAGYWQRPEATAESIDAEGWFKTGDVARMDEQGYLYIVDRLKDMILVSGFNVYPNEVEDVVALHEGVLEVAAIASPDEHSGEVVKIVVVKKDPALTEDDLHAHCKENLTGYKRPKIIAFMDELPKTNVGKILRRELREQGD
ncbi:MAG: AMP-binding protein [Pseudomonadota bacterium]